MISKVVLEERYIGRKMSAAEIAADLKHTFPSVLYWIKKHGIPIRSCSERTYWKLNPHGDPFCPKEDLSPEERELLVWGLALYWAEGSRKDPNVLHLANLDARLLRVFVRFLQDIVRVDEGRLRVDVKVFPGFDGESAKRYWSRALGVSPKRIKIYPHTDSRSKPKKTRSPFGIARVYVCNTKLKRWIDEQLEGNVKRLTKRWSCAAAHVMAQAVEGGHSCGDPLHGRKTFESSRRMK